MSIYQEFANDQDVVTYINTYFSSIEAQARGGNTDAMRLLDHSTLMICAVASYKVNVNPTYRRAAEFSIMIAAEAIRDYEISIGLRNDHSA